MHSYDASTQHVVALVRGSLKTLVLPRHDRPVRGLATSWGDASTPMTAAYWAAQTWMWDIEEPEHFRLGRTLQEELLACMLGGHGIPAEVGLAAYRRLRGTMAASPETLLDRDAVNALLAAPLDVDGRPVRYRFASQKAGYVSAAFRKLPELDGNADDRSLRDGLTSLKGVGPKTASWVVRNLRASDEVAILDVHIIRAGRALGIFRPEDRVERHYGRMEDAYLRFADAISTRASILDSVIWMTMRQLAAAEPSRKDARTRAPRATAQYALTL